MKHLRGLFALTLAASMTLSATPVAPIATALAIGTYEGYPYVINTPHQLIIKNTDQNVSHTYKAYQVFRGNLNAAEGVLSDIMWGANVDAAKLIAAIKSELASTNDTNLQALFTAANNIASGQEADGASAVAIAQVLATFSDTSDLNQSAGALDEFAEILDAAGVITGTGTSFTENADGGEYTATITGGDGYYLVKDETTTPGGLEDADVMNRDTLSKFLLTLVKDTTVYAKDTSTHSDKVIVEDETDKNDRDAAIGDVITYKSTLSPIPDPTKYDTFKLEMHDTMESGLTFTGIQSIEIVDDSGTVIAVVDDPDDPGPFPSTGKTLTVGTDFEYYVAKSDATVSDWGTAITSAYPPVADPVDADAPSTKTQVKVVFKNARSLIRGNASDATENAPAKPADYAGKQLVVTYTAVLNKNAEFAPASNDNTANFEFSNNPNYDYSGDEITSTDPTGETPDKTVEVYTTRLEIKKEDGHSNALDGAVFTIRSDAFNEVLESGEFFVRNGMYYKADGTTIEEDVYDRMPAEKQAAYTQANNGNYYRLKDGSYTLTAPGNGVNETQYSSEGFEGVYTQYARVSYSSVVKVPEGTGLNKTYTVTSDANGLIKLDGVKAGTYTIKEIQAPDGYNLLGGAKMITVTWSEDTVHGNDTWESPTDAKKTSENGGFSAIGSDIGPMDSNGGVYKITIVNQAGSKLPSTGGIGTTIFYVVGGILVAGAAVTLVVRRRAQSEA